MSRLADVSQDKILNILNDSEQLYGTALKCKIDIHAKSHQDKLDLQFTTTAKIQTRDPSTDCKIGSKRPFEKTRFRINNGMIIWGRLHFHLT